MMPRIRNILRTGLLALLVASPAFADQEEDNAAAKAQQKAIAQDAKYVEAHEVFRRAVNPGFFEDSYGYALFPNIGKAAFIIGGAHGSGRVYANGRYVGDTKVTQGSIGFQAGGQAFSQIIFFEDERAFNEFTSGNFEFGAHAGAVALTAGANASTSTTGNTAGASGGKNDASVAGGYTKGYAIFVIAKGGLMFEASVGGQKFSYTPRP